MTSKKLRIVETDMTGFVRDGWIVCMQCGDVEKHVFVEASRLDGNDRTRPRGYRLLFKCKKCGTVRQWGYSESLPPGIRANDRVHLGN